MALWKEQLTKSPEKALPSQNSKSKKGEAWDVQQHKKVKYVTSQMLVST